MSYKALVEIWGNYTDLSKRLILELDAEHNLLVIDMISRNELARFTPKIKSRVLYEVIEVFGFTNKV
jgi:hypothetical protein